MGRDDVYQDYQVSLQSTVVYIILFFPDTPQASKTGLFGLLTGSVIVATSLLSVSRILALNQYYHAPLSLVYRFQYDELPRIMTATGLLKPWIGKAEEAPRIDLSPLAPLNLSLCIGKEWYRFPGHFLVPDEVRVDWIRSAFDGQLPRHFDEDAKGTTIAGWEGVWKRLDVTRRSPADLNDLNKGDASKFVSFLPM